MNSFMDAEHLVVIGDSKKMRELASQSVQLIVTSPPNPHLTLRSVRRGSVSNDFNDYLRRLLKVFRECHRVLQNGHYLCINLRESAGHMMPFPAHFLMAMHWAGFQFCEDVFWGSQPKESNSKGRQSGLFSPSAFMDPNFQVQRTLVFRKGEKGRSHLLGKSMGYDAPGELALPDETDSLCQNLDAHASRRADAFSEKLVEVIIQQFTKEGETVLDPFLGSGALSRAAAHLHRHSVGYDSDGYHARIIRKNAGIPDGHLKVVFQREGVLT